MLPKCVTAVNAAAAAAGRTLERAVYQTVYQGVTPSMQNAHGIEDSTGGAYHSRGGTRTRDPGIMRDRTMPRQPHITS